jgi:hypothetical protein
MLLQVLLYMIFIILGYLFYLILGFMVMALISEKILTWVESAPTRFLFTCAWTLWPVMIVAYYILPGDREDV